MSVEARSSSPLAALGLLLAGLAVAGLSAAPAPSPPPPVERHAEAPPTQVPRLLADQPLELNAATEADLRLLPRIGPTLAARIVADRTERGCFSDVSQLTRVRGIGVTTLERLAPLVSVDTAAVGCVPGP